MIGLSLQTAGQLRFGQRPPQLFTPLTEEEKQMFPPEVYWEDTKDGVWIKGKMKEIPLSDIEAILQTPAGRLYLLPLLGVKPLSRTIGRQGLKFAQDELGRVRVIKECVKKGLRDTEQDYWPIRVDHDNTSWWMHRHDMMHLRVSKLRPITMGKTSGVDGISGHSYRVVPHFHPNNPGYKAKYNGLLDEYRVAIHVYCLNPSAMNYLRLLYYMFRFIKLVPNPITAIHDHRQTMIEAGLLPAKSLKPNIKRK